MNKRLLNSLHKITFITINIIWEYQSRIRHFRSGHYRFINHDQCTWKVVYKALKTLILVKTFFRKCRIFMSLCKLAKWNPHVIFLKISAWCSCYQIRLAEDKHVDNIQKLYFFLSVFQWFGAHFWRVSTNFT